MIIEYNDPKLNLQVFVDSRLKNQQSRFCLCTRCIKTNIYEGETAVCSRHDDFINETTRLQVGAPIFTCPEFKERLDQEDLLLVGLKGLLVKSSKTEIRWVATQLLKYLKGLPI